MDQSVLVIPPTVGLFSRWAADVPAPPGSDLIVAGALAADGQFPLV